MKARTTGLPSLECVSSLLEYHAEIGIFLRRKDTRGARAGQIAGCSARNGYVMIRVADGAYLAHRIAWLLSYGEWPDGVIDHINGVRSDNRLANLRLCSTSENLRNAKLRSDNTSGVKGIYWNKKLSSWQVHVKDGGRTVYGGIYKDLDDAKRAVMQLRERLHGEFANHAGIKADSIAMGIQ
jgi:hypothetical protein